MATPVEEVFPYCHCLDWELIADLNEIQADRIIIDTKLVKIEHSYTNIYKKCHVTMMTV